MFQTKHLNPNYTRIRGRCENGVWEWKGDLISQCTPFLGINLLKEARYLASPNKNLTSWIINNAKIH